MASPYGRSAMLGLSCRNCSKALMILMPLQTGRRAIDRLAPHRSGPIEAAPQTAELAGLAERIEARCGLLTGTEVLGTRLSRRADKGGWLLGSLARREGLERRRDPGATPRTGSRLGDRWRRPTCPWSCGTSATRAQNPRMSETKETRERTLSRPANLRSSLRPPDRRGRMRLRPRATPLRAAGRSWRRSSNCLNGIVIDRS